MKKIKLLVALLLIGLGVVFTIYADTVVNMQFLFSGKNIYAPTLINDGTVKMWYGGWQTQADYPNDRIYYRTSYDGGSSWSAPITVLKPSDIGSYVIHVNDPSVTKHLNQTNGQWQYTMFYTLCASPGNQTDNQVWSIVSTDGIHWQYNQPLLANNAGSAEPSAIVDPQPDGTFWKVYYVDRTDMTRVKMAKVDGARNVISTQVVYQHPGNISGVEVRQFNGAWHLFFNAFFANRVDIYKVQSNSNESWGSNYEVLIDNSGPSYCGALTPGVLPIGGNQYDLYFGLTPRTSSTTCDVSHQETMQKWRWAN